MNPKPTHLLIPVDFAQAVVNYLQTKPFQEVAAMIQVFASLPKAPTAEDAEPPEAS